MDAAVSGGGNRLPPQTAAASTTARVLKPSLKQSRKASPTRTTPSVPTPQPPPSSSSSFTKSRLQANLQFYHFLTRVQSLLISTPASTPTTLHRASLVLRPCDYQEILVERSHSSLCALPTCSNPTTRNSGRYRLSLSQHRVWDVSDEVRYCCRECEEQSVDYLAGLKEDPAYLRRFGDLMRDMQEKEREASNQGGPSDPNTTEQGRVVEALHSLPASSPTHESTSALTASLPAGADPSSLIIRENEHTRVDPVVGARATVNDRLDSEGTQVQVQRKKRANLPLRPSSSVPPRPPPSSSSAAEDVDVDSLTLIALQESAKRRNPMNPIQALPTRPTPRPSAEDDQALQSEAEMRANMAAMRRSRVLSPFAEILSGLTHWVGEETVALLGEKGRLARVEPSVVDVVRDRQEAMLSILHRELHSLLPHLPLLPPSSSLLTQVDAVALTFVANESVPGLSSAQWQVILLVLLLALQSSGKADAWTVDDSEAFKVAKGLGYDRPQVEALVNILTPYPVARVAVVSAVPAPPPPPVRPMSSLPRDVIVSVLSYLPSDDVLTASQLSSLLHLLAHPLSSSDVPLLAHHTSLVTQRMHTLGYRDGVTAGREILMQPGFDRALRIAYTRTLRQEAVNGVIGALAMWSVRSGTTDKSADEIWRRCDDVNGKVMHRPLTPDRISLENSPEQVDTPPVPLDAFCIQRLEHEGVDGQEILSQLTAGEDVVDVTEAEAEALISGHLAGLRSVNVGDRGGGEEESKEDADWI